MRRVAVLCLALLLAACGSPGASGGQQGSNIQRLATYQGADRQAMLEAGARKEGKVTLYTITVQDIGKPLADAFHQKYPYLEVETFRAGTAEVITRAVEEYQAKRYQVDVMEANTFNGPLEDRKIVRPFWSPELANYPDKAKDQEGISVSVRESPRGFGFNTKAISREQAPKTWADLLGPRWKGKFAIGSQELPRFTGFLVETQGEDYVQKLGAQDPTLVNVSVRALADQVASGEVPLSITINKAHVQAIRAKGGPIDWIGPDPLDSLVARTALAANAPHPHAALLFLDFLLSKEGQQIYMKGGYDSGRSDLAPTGENAYNGFHIDDVPDMPTKLDQWSKLANKYFHLGA